VGFDHLLFSFIRCFSAGGSRTVLEQLSFPPPLAPLLLLSSSPSYLLITIPPDVSHPECPSLAVTLTRPHRQTVYPLFVGHLSNPTDLLHLISLLRTIAAETAERHRHVGNWLWCLRDADMEKTPTKGKRKRKGADAAGGRGGAEGPAPADLSGEPSTAPAPGEGPSADDAGGLQDRDGEQQELVEGDGNSEDEDEDEDDDDVGDGVNVREEESDCDSDLESAIFDEGKLIEWLDRVGQATKPRPTQTHTLDGMQTRHNVYADMTGGINWGARDVAG